MKPVFFLVAVLLVAGAFTGSALPRNAGNVGSATRAFSLDGEWYSVGKPSDSGFVLRKKLQAMNLDLSRVPPDVLAPGSLAVDVLSEIPANRTSEPIPLSSFLRQEHDLQLASGNRHVGISFGKISGSRDQAKKSLARSGWKLAGTEKSGDPFSVATIRNERETSIVLLEEKEGSYLLLRQLEE